MDTCSAVLTFESVNEILWCDHSNEISSAVLLHGTIRFSIFYKTNFGIFFAKAVRDILPPVCSSKHINQGFPQEL